MARAQAQALLVLAFGPYIVERQRLAELALRHRLPTMFNVRDHAEAGGLLSYGTDLNDLSRRGAAYVNKILKGAKPADLPVEQPTKFELVINLKTAQALGITMPPSLLILGGRGHQVGVVGHTGGRRTCREGLAEPL